MQDFDFGKQLESESWDQLAIMLRSIPIKLEGPKLRKVKKEMQLLRHVLHAQLLTLNGNNEVDMSFFVSCIKSFGRIEKKLESNGIQNNEFMVFFRLLIGKMRKQKLLVKKPLEMQKEFGRMKGVIDDDYTL